MRIHSVRPRAPARHALLLTAALLLAGCADHRIAVGPPAPDSLSDWIQKMRVLQSETRPAPPAIAIAPRLERSDPQLAAALVALAAVPSADAHIRIAMEYRRLGILDHAYSHLSDAIAIDPTSATAYDLRARIWRDWRVPHLGYVDAYKALEFAPASPSAMNTLGTLFQTAGNPQAARLWYERAMTFDPYADYALTNACHLEMMRGVPKAIEACQYALATAPEALAARNNLAAVYASLDTPARDRLATGNGTATALYANGVALFAHRQYGKALQAFATALRINPLLPLTPERMRADRRIPAVNGE